MLATMTRIVEVWHRPGRKQPTRWAVLRELIDNGYQLQIQHLFREDEGAYRWASSGVRYWFPSKEEAEVALACKLLEEAAMDLTENTL